jgi:hypothetical protein
MGIDIIKIGDRITTDGGQSLKSDDLVQLTCRDYTLGDPGIKIWLMVGYKDRPIFPWWQYDHKLDADIQALSDLWSVSTPQGLFDCLFLSTLKRFGGNNFFAIIPGNVKSDGWGKLKESDRNTFLRGQGCVYHLQGEFTTKLALNWVPFYQPQSLVRNPSFSNMWRLYAASQGEDINRCISFFSLSDPSKLAKVISLLIEPDDTRSERLTELVDWFGLYTAPVDDHASPACVLYTQHKEQIARFSELQKTFTGLFEEGKHQLLQSAVPSTVIRFLSRHIAL